MAKFGQYESLLKQLLRNKDSLASQKAGDRNQYQIRINDLKKQMKAKGLKFGQLLKDVKGQEKEGSWSRTEKKKSIPSKAMPHSKASLDFNPNKRAFKTDKEYREWQRQKLLYQDKIPWSPKRMSKGGAVNSRAIAKKYFKGGMV